MPQYAIHHRPDVKLTGDQEKLKAAFLSLGEEFTAPWHNILQLDPRYFQAYLGLRQVPLQKQRLPRKVQELVLLAMDASVTLLYEPGIAAHTTAALRAGASKQEILETLELTSAVGIHGLNVGMPLLEEVLREKGQHLNSANTALDQRQHDLKASFEKKRGYWSSTWDPILAVDPDFFEAYTNFSSVPFQADHSALDPKTKELIYCAIDCAATHLYQPGLKLHIRNAINHGATTEEVVEVFELSSLIGLQTVLRGADILTEELEKEQKHGLLKHH